MSLYRVLLGQPELNGNKMEYFCVGLSLYSSHCMNPTAESALSTWCVSLREYAVNSFHSYCRIFGDWRWGGIEVKGSWAAVLGCGRLVFTKQLLVTMLCEDGPVWLTEGWRGDRLDYLILLRVLHRRGLPAEVRALGSTLVLPSDRATWLVSDTLNLSGVACPKKAVTDEQGKGPAVIQRSQIWLKHLNLNLMLLTWTCMYTFTCHQCTGTKLRNSIQSH